LVFEPPRREGRKAFFESERTIRKNSHYSFCVKRNHSPKCPKGRLLYRIVRSDSVKKQNLGVLCVFSVAGGKK